jgi:hypothetical protein
MQRDPDTAPAPLDSALGRIRVTREIPLWGIITVLGALGVQAVALYYGQQRLVEELGRQGQRQTEMASDVRSVAGEMQKGSVETMKLTFTVNNLEQRVRTLENAPVGQPRR